MIDSSFKKFILKKKTQSKNKLLDSRSFGVGVQITRDPSSVLGSWPFFFLNSFYPTPFYRQTDRQTPGEHQALLLVENKPTDSSRTGYIRVITDWHSRENNASESSGLSSHRNDQLGRHFHSRYRGQRKGWAEYCNNGYNELSFCCPSGLSKAVTSGAPKHPLRHTSQI